MSRPVQKQQVLDFGFGERRRCEPIPPKEALEYLEYGHYLRRVPSISYAFGLYRGGELEGVITYGTPPSAPLRSGICGDEFSSLVLEMNRLFLVENRKNDASWLIAKSVKLLPKPAIVVSYADPTAGHSGVVYRAANFLYCGLSAKRTDWHINGDARHGISVADEFRGQKDRAKAMRAKYGDAFKLVARPQKHRFVMFLGTKGERRRMLRALRWHIHPPNGNPSPLKSQ